jgi:hypothetical protein
VRIASPKDGVVVAPGKSLTVTIEVSGTTYAQVLLIGHDPIGIVGALATPPYRFTITLPADITPGPYALTAIGVIKQGELDTSMPVDIDVESDSQPASWHVEPRSLDMRPGDHAGLRVFARLANGSKVDMTFSTRTTYVSDAPKVVTVSHGLVIAKGPGAAHIVVNGSMSIPVSVRAR